MRGGTFPRQVVHAMGETEIEKRPESVVALDMTFVDAALTLGLDVAGYTTLSGQSELPDYLAEAAEEHAADATPVGTLSEPSLEKVARLNPDLVLSAKVRHEELYGQLSGVAPTVFSEQTGATFKENLTLTAEATGREAEASKALEEYQARAQRIGDRVREKEGENPTFAVVRFVDGPTRIYREDTYIGVVMQDLGFATIPAGEGTGFNTEISDEEIEKMDADHIFVATYADEAGLSAKTKEQFKANPLWGKLKGEVHEVPDGTWMSAVGLQGAHSVLDDVAETFEVDPS